MTEIGRMVYSCQPLNYERNWKVCGNIWTSASAFRRAWVRHCGNYELLLHLYCNYSKIEQFLKRWLLHPLHHRENSKWKVFHRPFDLFWPTTTSPWAVFVSIVQLTNYDHPVNTTSVTFQWKVQWRDCWWDCETDGKICDCFLCPFDKLNVMPSKCCGSGSALISAKWARFKAR